MTDAMTAAACALMALVIACCVIIAAGILRGHQPGCLRRTAAARITRALLRAAIAVLSVRAVRSALVRVRWAWRCRRCPPPGSEVDPLEEWEREELITIRRGRRKTARPERSRT